MKVYNLDAIAPWIPKVTAKWWDQFDFVFGCQLLPNLGNLRFVSYDEAKMFASVRL